MGRTDRLLDEPLVRYLVIGTFSVLASYLFWRIGGNFARVVSKNAFVGVTFELGGAIAGFVSVFLTSLWAFTRLVEMASIRKIKVFLIPRDQFSVHENYTCKVRIYDSEAGLERTVKVVPRSEAGFLTVDLLDLRNSERFLIEVRSTQNRTWKSEFNAVAAPRAEMHEAPPVERADQ